MQNLRIEKLHIWTDGDSVTGRAGEMAEVSAPGWLVSSEDYGADDFKVTLEAFREKVREAFGLIWSGERVHAKYDFELREEDTRLDAPAN